MPINPGREPLNVQMRAESKQELRELKEYYRGRMSPLMSMTQVLELLIGEKYRKLKLHQKKGKAVEKSAESD